MAIRKRSQQSILTEKPESLDFLVQEADSDLKPSAGSGEVSHTPDEKIDETHVVRTRHKSVDNWGRPRKELIKGVKEFAVTVQLPETLIKALRKLGKKDGRSMKDLIGSALIEKYNDFL